MLERIPPQSLDAEQAVIGAMLLEKSAIVRAIDLVVPEDFYRESHRMVFQVLTDMYARKTPADLIMVCEELKRREQLDAIGGTLFLTTAMSQVPTAAGIDHYCGIVKAKSRQRALIKAADEIMEAAYVGELSLEELLPACEQKILSIGDGLKPVGGPKTMNQLAYDVYHSYESAYDNEVAPGFRSGYAGLNGILSPFKPAQLTVIGARPGMGKTALGLQLCLSFAEQNIPGLIFSLEMGDEELGLRAMLSYMQLEQNQLDDFTKAVPNKEEYLADLSRGADAVYNLPIGIDDRPSLSIAEMDRTIRRWRREHGKLDWILVDYCQLASADKKYGTQAEAIGAVIYGLHGLSKAHHLHVFALSQLNRDVEKLEVKRPQLYHFFGAGMIEAAAYRVLSIYRPAIYGENECRAVGVDIEQFAGMTEVSVLKQRGGGCAQTQGGRMLTSTWMYYDGGHYRFRDPSMAEWQSVIPEEKRRGSG